MINNGTGTFRVCLGSLRLIFRGKRLLSLWNRLPMPAIFCFVTTSRSLAPSAFFCMYVHILHVSMCVYYIHAYIYIYMYIYICISVCVSVCICVQGHACMGASLRPSMHACVRVWVRAGSNQNISPLRISLSLLSMPQNSEGPLKEPPFRFPVAKGSNREAVSSGCSR